MKLVFSTIALIVLVTGFAAAQSSTKDDTALKAVVRKLVDAQIAYDAKMLDSIFTSDYIEISPLGEFDPRAKVLGFYAPDQKPPATMNISVEDTEYSIRSYGSHAVVIVRLKYTMSADGKPMPPRSIRTTFLLEKEKGGWKIASAQYTGIRPAQPPKT